MSAQPAPNAPAPVGVFDSGIGGLSVLRALRTLLPHEDFIYVADTAYAPYGEKSEAAIQARCFALSDFLLQQGAKALVIACNTATAVALQALRARYKLPIMALEPALKPAVAASRSHIVGVLATRRTVESTHFHGQVARYADQARILPQACPTLVTLLEAGAIDSPAMTEALQDYIAPLLAQGADTLVLGCTHFVFLREHIRRIAGDAVQLFDSGDGVARVLRDRLMDAALYNQQTARGKLTFYSSAATPATRQVMERLWGEPLQLLPLP